MRKHHKDYFFGGGFFGCSLLFSLCGRGARALNFQTKTTFQINSRLFFTGVRSFLELVGDLSLVPDDVEPVRGDVGVGEGVRAEGGGEGAEGVGDGEVVGHDLGGGGGGDRADDLKKD